MYPNLKTTCHIKLKFFLWTKLIEKLLVAKPIISVTPPSKRVVQKRAEATVDLFSNEIDDKIKCVL